MDNSGSKLGSDSQDSQDFAEDVKFDKPGPSVKPTLAVQNAKKRLRAFSIQKRTMSPVAIPKPVSTGSATVFIGKLASVKPVIKPAEDPEKKLPKPPKPGASRQMTDSYIHLRKNTLDEIEDMKRKMELVELGIPLGLICPAPNSVTANKAMPTKAMPPIKSFLDPAKVDEIIREAKKAKAEGREFKFNYNKFVPDYANPFQRKKDEYYQIHDKKDDKGRGRDKYTKRTDKYDSRRPYNKHSEKDTYKDRYKNKPKERDERHKEKEKQREKSKDKEDRSKERERSKDTDLKYDRKDPVKPESKKDDEKPVKKDFKKDDLTEAKEVKETDVNLKDFLVCDSWSLDNDDKSKDATPKPEETEQNTPPKVADPLKKLKHSILKKDSSESPTNKPKIEKLKPVIDSFKYEIEEDEDLLDMFDETTSMDKFAQKDRPYQSPDMKLFDIESKDASIDELADDTFLESVINEIKSEVMDDSSQDKGLVEYDSPKDERLSITPELDSSRMSSSRSDYSDGYKSIESGYKSTESGYKSTESGYKATERTYKLTERGYKSPQRNYKSPERRYKSPEQRYKSPERSYKSPERSYKSPDRSYKSPERGYKSPQRNYKSPEQRYKSPERSYKSPDRSYKSPDRSYKSPERGYKSPQRKDKSPEQRHKSPERSYKSPDRSYKSPERSYKSPERYKSSERNYKSPEITYSPERYKSPEPYKSPQRTYKSPERTYKSPERSYKSPQRTNKSERYKSNRSSMEKETGKLARSTVDSLETWDFVLKVCQPLLFRHDKNRCYKETRNIPKVWFSENPKLCDCIKDRSTVYEELELAKMELVDRVHACDQMSEASFHTARGWYPPAHQCLVESSTVQPSTEWEAEDSQLSPSGKEISLDREYHRFMKAVWPEAESKSATPRGTPTRVTKPDAHELEEPRAKKTKLSSEGWSQESDLDDEAERKKIKVVKDKRKRKRSTSTLTDSEVESKKRKKSLKKKDAKKTKAKSSKHLSKKVLKKLKEKHKKKKKLIKIEETDEDKKEKKKKEKRAKKKKAQKQKKKNIKKKKSRKHPSSSTSETTQTDSEFERKKAEKKKKKRQKSTSESTQSDDAFDVNILNNIKTERLTDDENKLEFPKHREIINVKELQNDFVGNSIQIKKEEEEIEKVEEIERDVQDDKSERESESPVSDVNKHVNLDDIKIPDDPPPSTPQLKPDESSQDTQDSAPSKVYEKDESHLRPSSQNSNYSFQDVMQSGMYQKELEMEPEENYEGNYEMYEQMAMEYQSDVATQRTSPQRIETVVRSRVRGEIKCDWRPGDNAGTDAAYTPQRPSRWGLKPSEVNIVLTGGSEHYPIPTVVQPVYKIQSIANNRNDNSNTGYDEAYQDMYGAADKLQYGDCFNAEVPSSAPAQVPTTRVSSLDDRINRALRTTVLGEVAKEPEENEAEKDSALPVVATETRNVKRVSFADGYKPGQDSDTEEPPKKKKKRRVGCAWPCPSSHPDHVPLWDALPPPPPPPGSPPPPHRHPLPAHLLRDSRRMMPPLLQLPTNMHKFDPNMPFMPPEPPPGILNF